MTKGLERNNRRKFPRFKVDTDLFVLHSYFGKVVEIGMGGIVYTYVEKDNLIDETDKKGVIFNGKDDYLAELPFRTISDAVLYKSPYRKLNIIKRVVVFDELEGDQIEKLEQLIMDNVFTTHTDGIDDMEIFS